jgi:cell division protein FtsL
MSSKTFSFNSVFPSITSITKTEKNIKESPKRATGAVLVKRASKPVSNSRSRSRLSWGGSNLIGSLSAIGLIAIVAGLSFYIYTINASVSKGFELKQNQTALNDLQEVQKRLVVEQAALGSINKVNDVASTVGMVPVTNEEFLSTNQLSKR